MGWAHEGAVTSSAVNVATMTRVGGLGVAVESATAFCVVVVPEPTAAVPGPGSEVLEPSAEVPGLVVAAPESDPTVPGAAGTKMDSDSGEGLIDGVRRR